MVKNTIYYFQFPNGVEEGMIRGITINIVTFIGIWLLFHKFGPLGLLHTGVGLCGRIFSVLIMSVLLTSALGAINTNSLEETCIYSSMIGLLLFGFNYFSIFSPFNIVLYKELVKGVVLSLLAGIFGYLSTRDRPKTI